MRNCFVWEDSTSCKQTGPIDSKLGMWKTSRRLEYFLSFPFLPSCLTETKTTASPCGPLTPLVAPQPWQKLPLSTHTTDAPRNQSQESRRLSNTAPRKFLYLIGPSGSPSPLGLPLSVSVSVSVSALVRVLAATQILNAERLWKLKRVIRSLDQNLWGVPP